MIAQALVDEVRRLLEEGRLSQRKIARTTGVSRASVGAIASGRRRDYLPRVVDDEEEMAPLGPLGRCRSCGGMVYMPCRLCRVRAIKAEERRKLMLVVRRGWRASA